MKIFETITETQLYLQKNKNDKNKIGFVPTMGALHQGHLNLVKQAKSENDIVVVSIFVNPIQFNNEEDLLKYPRTLQKDADLLQKVGCYIIFAPNEKEIYPEPDTTIYNFGLLDKVMEGKFRPGHFNGVAIVVKKLFDIVMPDNAYFGEKDYQQLQIIKSLVKQMNIPVNIIPCPIVREVDGLAMSSRNMRLTDEERKVAPFIYQILLQAKGKMNKLSPKEITQWVNRQIEIQPLLRMEYFEVVNATTLLPISNWDDCEHAIGCIAVFLGNIRLIDNINLI
ncbi:MAG: pantoate--beta-alanine ligase [Bacteroidetes bacterium]|nr:pantoate--beta-alanine ligase [Bacteroidota bacterium]